MTVGIPSATERACGASADADLLLARARVGLRVVLAAIGVFTLADVRLVGDGLHEALLVRLAQFAVIGLTSLALRAGMSARRRVVAVAAFVGAIYVTSAIAGVLRGGTSTQPITDLAIAFATATTLPWGPWPQLATVAVAMAAIATAAVHAGHGTLAGTSPHMAAGLAVAFLVSVYIAHQLERYRRQRDAAEVALRHSEERFRSLIEHGSDVITIVGPDGAICYESPSMKRLLGHRCEALPAHEAARRVHPEDLPAVATAFAGAVAARTASVECRVARSDGSWCQVEALFTNLLDHPAVGGVVVNWRDIGERKRAEAERARHVAELARARDQALASTRSKSLFLANMSHEIRTPMNVIIGMTDMVLDSALTAEQRDALARVRAAAIGLLGIINDVLDASKIEAGRMTIEVVEMNLRRTIEDAAGLLTPAAATKGLTLAVVIPPDLPARLKGDPVRLRQTLVNLIGNAVKFTEAGSVTVEASVVQRRRAHVTVRLSVTDTGIGIPPERQASIFESFAQGDDSTTRVYGGTGLGLAICRDLVTLMGGRMGVESEPGRGSAFWLELTLERAAVETPAAA
ncbi:MAG TPA: ATP-binding protein [Candidatus Binatia bacterium]|nr:ATP-binding protein [Candidatus Binatia bacterium]